MKYLIVVLLSLFCVVIACKTNDTMAASENENIPIQPVNYPDYEDQWEQVRKQEELGKPKSANELVEAIYQQAKEEQNAPQVYKALAHLAKYTLTLEEDAELTVVNRFKEEINKADTPTKQILQTALAELYK